MPQHAVKCVERCLRVPDAYIQQRTAHIEKHNISTLISTGCTETDALAFSSWGRREGDWGCGGEDDCTHCTCMSWWCPLGPRLHGTNRMGLDLDAVLPPATIDQQRKK